MASSPATTSRVLFAVLLVAVTAGIARAANVLVINNCPFTVWPAATPPELGGGTQLNPGQTWQLPVSAGTNGARIWARTGCIFSGNCGRCVTGDCNGALRCEVSGKPPATLAEFTVGKDANDLDYYDVSVVDGFNLPMDFSSTGSAEGPIMCRDPGCPDGSHGGVAKVRQCRGNSDYQVTFCP
ncbi:hypothetical protein PR202_ga11825 [Eleusine coracana subsp. coracana]|uniref:Thaumatin-like protein n=1 Tax=Eleusine coracana subsp. coracana TaxID=191504 RepID=A0AAV5CAJ1_ELECO|nr:hypothetical protein QOZ80_5AG0398310 [Eleusine coracana subsp. coracana]GJM95120.1 hypothetical protein PR202_ga11825 [Eleusine coracana subsp. coracana]